MNHSLAVKGHSGITNQSMLKAWYEIYNNDALSESNVLVDECTFFGVYF